MKIDRRVIVLATLLLLGAHRSTPAAEVTFPPRLPDDKASVTDTSDSFLKSPIELKAGVTVAKTAPTVDFAFFPGQDYPGKPWSAWGDSLAANGKYYASIGDHLAPAGNAFIYEYDPNTKTFRQLLDLKKLLNLPEGHYAPGKIHTRLDIGSDGWIYAATHRGSTRVTTDQYHYKGDWVVRCNPETAKSEVVVHAPVAKHCIPNGTLDPVRMIFYGGTAPGSKAEEETADGKGGIQFFAYDVKNRKMLYSGPNGPSRYMILAESTGQLYYTPGKDDMPLMRFDPSKPDKVTPLDKTIGIRAATRETPDNMVYTVSQGSKGDETTLFAFNTKSEKVESLGAPTVGEQSYIASLQTDARGRYLYYVAGAHGGSDKDGSPLVQFDTKTRKRKVIAFLNAHFQEKYGFSLKGTYSLAVDPSGDKVFITWNLSRGGKAWDYCGVTTVHVPESERE